MVYCQGIINSCAYSDFRFLPHSTAGKMGVGTRGLVAANLVRAIPDGTGKSFGRLHYFSMDWFNFDFRHTFNTSCQKCRDR